MKHPLVARLKNEWEFAALITSIVLLAAGVIGLCLALREPKLNDASAGNMPAQPSRINGKSAYAMLDAPRPAAAAIVDPFASDLGAPEKPPVKPDPVKPPVRPDPVKPPVRPDPVKPPVRPDPPPEPDPPKPAIHVYSYGGFVTNQAGDQGAVIVNETTGTKRVYRQGQKFRGYMVAEIAAARLVLYSPAGKETIITVADKLQLPAEAD